MRLNSFKPAQGSKQNRHRVGRGGGSRPGQDRRPRPQGPAARTGGFHKVGFEGGQMPLHRRLPKRGFHSLTRDDVAEVRLSELETLTVAEVDLAALQAAGIVSEQSARRQDHPVGQADQEAQRQGRRQGFQGRARGDRGRRRQGRGHRDQGGREAEEGKKKPKPEAKGAEEGQKA